MNMDWRSAGYWPVWKDGKKVWVPKDKDLDEHIKLIAEENKELLERLGSDYDEDGIPYWEKHND